MQWFFLRKNYLDEEIFTHNLTDTPSLKTSLALRSPQATDKSFHLNIRNRVTCSREGDNIIAVILVCGEIATVSLAL